MAEQSFDTILNDVSRSFKAPSDIVASKNFTDEQKIKLLSQWEIDLRLLMVASDENMAGTEPGRTANLLTGVRSALQDLGAPTNLEQSGPGKSGGGGAQSPSK